METGRPFTMLHAGEDLHGWDWGEGPAVLLAHGWGSRAGRWSALAPALVAAGYRVIAYDAPAHGRSGGSGSSLPEFSRALRAMAAHVGPLHGAVGHSLGGAAIAVALSHGLRLERAVLIAAPADAVSYADRFAEYLELSPEVRTLMRQNLERRLSVTWDQLHVPTIAGAFTTPALIIHDRDDKDVLPADAEAIAGVWPGAELLLTTGLGHRAIIRDAEVVRRSVEWLGGTGP